MSGRRFLHEMNGLGRRQARGSRRQQSNCQRNAGSKRNEQSDHPPTAPSFRHLVVKGRRTPLWMGWHGCRVPPDRRRGVGDRLHVNRRREPVASSRNRQDIDGLGRIVAKRAPQDRDAVGEAVVRHERIGPDTLHQLLFVHDSGVVLEQDEQRIERFAGQGKAFTIPDERSAGDLEPERTERIDFARLRHGSFVRRHECRRAVILQLVRSMRQWPAQNFHHDSAPFQQPVRTSSPSAPRVQPAGRSSLRCRTGECHAKTGRRWRVARPRSGRAGSHGGAGTGLHCGRSQGCLGCRAPGCDGRGGQPGADRKNAFCRHCLRRPIPDRGPEARPVHRHLLAGGVQHGETRRTRPLRIGHRHDRHRHARRDS